MIDQKIEVPESGSDVDRFKACEAEIMAVERFTPELSMRLGGKYISLLGDMATHNYFNNSHNEKAFEDRSPSNPIDKFHGNMKQCEVAVSKATNGDYTDIRNILESEVHLMWEEQKVRSYPEDPSAQKAYEYDEELYRQLARLVNLIPDDGRGPAFIPLDPVPNK